MQQTTDSVSFRDLARQAKKRLKSGYWESETKARVDAIENCKAAGGNVERINNAYRKKLEKNLYSAPETDPDEILYKKVCRLLDRNAYVLNPIKHLIDDDEYEKLDAVARQNYIIVLADKYNKLRERYNKEKSERKTGFS